MVVCVMRVWGLFTWFAALPGWIRRWWQEAPVTVAERRFLCGIVLLLAFGLAMRAYYRLAPRVSDFSEKPPAAEAVRPAKAPAAVPPDAKARLDADIGQLLTEEFTP